MKGGTPSIVTVVRQAPAMVARISEFLSDVLLGVVDLSISPHARNVNGASLRKRMRGNSAPL
jgi:hypothetical protein